MMPKLPKIKGVVKAVPPADSIVVDPVKELPVIEPEPVRVEPTVPERLQQLTKMKAYAQGEALLLAKGLNPAEYVIDAVEQNGQWVLTYRSRTQLDKNGNIVL